METPFPARILALAEQAGGVPLAYREDDWNIVIVFTDGRKLTFEKGIANVLPAKSRDVPKTVQIDQVSAQESAPISRDDIQSSSAIPSTRVDGKPKRKERKANG